MRGCEARADGTEPQDGEWWIHLEDGWMEPEVHDQKFDTAEAKYKYDKTLRSWAGHHRDVDWETNA